VTDDRLLNGQTAFVAPCNYTADCTTMRHIVAPVRSLELM